VLKGRPYYLAEKKGITLVGVRPHRVFIDTYARFTICVREKSSNNEIFSTITSKIYVAATCIG
jgi:hypothetical protein